MNAHGQNLNYKEAWSNQASTLDCIHESNTIPTLSKHFECFRVHPNLDKSNKSVQGK